MFATVAILLATLFSTQVRATEGQIFVVAQDQASLFYHKDETPTAIVSLPKGTELRIESVSGDRCFLTHNGKPAYIRRQFLVTKQEYFAAQQLAKGLVEYKGEWLTPEEKYAREQTDKGLAQYDGKWVTPEVKANLEKGLVQYDGEWVTPEEKFKSEQRAKGLVEYQGQWVVPDVKANMGKGLIEYNGVWVTPQQKDKLERERNLTNLKTAVLQRNYRYAGQFVGDQFPIPQIEQLQQKLGIWVEKEGALQQANTAVENTRRLAAQERVRVEKAQKQKYETYYVSGHFKTVR